MNLVRTTNGSHRVLNHPSLDIFFQGGVFIGQGLIPGGVCFDAPLRGFNSSSIFRFCPQARDLHQHLPPSQVSGRQEIDEKFSGKPIRYDKCIKALLSTIWWLLKEPFWF